MISRDISTTERMRGRGGGGTTIALRPLATTRSRSAGWIRCRTLRRLLSAAASRATANGRCFDLSATYGKPPGTVRRGAALIGRQVVIEDEVDPAVCHNVLWAIHTSAEPDLLSPVRWCACDWERIGSSSVSWSRPEPASSWSRRRRRAPSRSAPRSSCTGARQRGRHRVSELPRGTGEAGPRTAGALPIRRLQIAWPAGTRRLTVLLLPDCDRDELALPVAPLDHWLARQPIRLTGLPRRGCRTRSVHIAMRASPVRLEKSMVGYSRARATGESRSCLNLPALPPRQPMNLPRSDAGSCC